MSELYWFNRLDTIRMVCSMITLFGGVLDIVTIIYVCMLEDAEKFKKIILWLSMLVIICALVLLFLPSTEEALILSRYEPIK